MNKVLQVLFLWTFILISNQAFSQAKTTAKALIGISNAKTMVSKANEYVSKIDGAVTQVENSNLYKTLVDGYSVKFPIGILPDNGDKKYALIVNGAKLDPVLGMTIEVFMKVPVSSTRSLYFLADAIPISTDGSISGDFKLYLLKTERFEVGDGYDMQINGLGTGAADSTYITFNCKGFKDMTVNGALNFNPNTIVAHTEEGTARDTFALKFYAQCDKVANLILKFDDVPAFQFKSLPGFKCTVPTLTFDKSDVRNAPSFALPTWYVDSLRKKDPNIQYAAVTGNIWEGVYIPSIDIEIPRSFTEGSDKPGAMIVTARDIIVDQYGITALTKAMGAVVSNKQTPLFNANLKSFKISVDSIRFNIIASKLSRAGFYGLMSFPVCKDESKLDFGLTISQQMDKDYLDYMGYANWEAAKPLVANAFGLAQFSLTGCSIAFEYVNKQFYPSVAIDGTMLVMPKSKTSTSTIGTINFEFGYLIVSSKAPYLDLGGQGVKFTPNSAVFDKINAAANQVNTAVANGTAIVNNAQTTAQNIVNNAQATGQAAITNATNAVAGKVQAKANTLITGFFKLKAGAESKIAKLPVSITEVELIKDPNGRIGLGMVLGIKLQNSGGNNSSSSNGFGGSAGFKIWTKRSPTTQRWGYAGFDLTSIHIGVDQESFKLKGDLEMFENDIVYGKGFCGKIELDVIKKIHVEVAAIFGKKLDPANEAPVDSNQLGAVSLEAAEVPEVETAAATEYRYWFVDAFASFPAIPLAPGVGLNSFTGGLYYHMKMYQVRPATEDASTVDCQTASGRYFSPNRTVGLGLLAGVGLQSTGGGTAFNGNINFGLQFAEGGGLMTLATWGNVGFFDFQFSAPALSKVAEAMKAEKTLTLDTKKETAAAPPTVPDNGSSISASWFIEYDVPNKTFVGDFDIYMNFADGLIRGVNANDNAGHISIYASPEDWYVYIGKPVEPIGINILDIASATSYICFGSKLPNPAMAPIPSEIHADVEIDESLLSTGGGLSFGARLCVQGSPSINLFLCDAKIGLRFKVLAGFDVLLSHANETVMCGNEPRGHKNWYATGQTFLYGEAALHASYDCWIASDDFDIFSMYLSAFVFAQLPKPSYMQGNVSIGFRILGESFDESFPLKFGRQCGSSTVNNDVNFIESITPTDKIIDVSVSEKIVVTFSKALENFHYDMNTGGGNQTYRATLLPADIVLKNGTTPILFKYELDRTKTKLVITPLTVMPENKLINFSITIQSQVQSGSSWTNTAKRESQVISFTTRAEPLSIPVNTVWYAYPLPRMTNFYKDETTTGYVKLSTMPIKAVKLKSDYQFEVAIFENTVEVERVKTVTYNGTLGQNNFSFEIPNRRLENGKNYIFKLMKSPKFTNSQQTSTTTGSTTIGTVSVGSRDSVILEYTFSTSKYATYKDKMSYYGQTVIDIVSGVTNVNLAVNKAKALGASFEPLSPYETGGFYQAAVQTTPELIQLGNISYDNTFLAGVQSLGTSIGTAYAALSNGSFSGTTDVISKLNTLMKEANLTCLISGGCSASQVKEITIPAGNITLPIGYYLPGQTTPVSEYQVSVTLPNQIKIPSN